MGTDRFEVVDTETQDTAQWSQTLLALGITLLHTSYRHQGRGTVGTYIFACDALVVGLVGTETTDTAQWAQTVRALTH